MDLRLLPSAVSNHKTKNMKRYLQFLIVLGFGMLTNNLFAQVSFSCNYREYCSWNNYTERFGDCNGYEESSLFVMNDSETMFTHTIESMKSTYYVTSREYDAENEVYTYFVTSDVGNKYYYVFDPKNKEVRAMYTDDNDETTLLRFYVKAIF